MSCVLRRDGKEFRVDDFLKSTELKPIKYIELEKR